MTIITNRTIVERTLYVIQRVFLQTLIPHEARTRCDRARLVELVGDRLGHSPEESEIKLDRAFTSARHLPY